MAAVVLKRHPVAWIGRVRPQLRGSARAPDHVVELRLRQPAANDGEPQVRLRRGVRADAHEPKSFPCPADVPRPGVLEQHRVQSLDARQCHPGKGELGTMFGHQGIAGGHEIVQRQSRSQVKVGPFRRGDPDAVEHHDVPAPPKVQPVARHVRPLRDASAPRPRQVDPPVAVRPQGKADAPDPRRREVAEHRAVVELAVGPQRGGALCVAAGRDADTAGHRDQVLGAGSFPRDPGRIRCQEGERAVSQRCRELKSAHFPIMV
jgi:hypothetical protein